MKEKSEKVRISEHYNLTGIYVKHKERRHAYRYKGGGGGGDSYICGILDDKKVKLYEEKIENCLINIRKCWMGKVKKRRKWKVKENMLEMKLHNSLEQLQMYCTCEYGMEH